MSKKHYVGTAWVSEDGSYSFNNQLVTFSSDELTQKQWEILDELNDYDRIEYVLAILDGDDLTEWENEDD